MPYLTPDTAPEDTVCRVMRIPNDTYWIAIVDGAVSELVRRFNFEKFGTATPEETANRFLDMYIDFSLSNCEDIMSGCCYDVVRHRVTSDGIIQISVNDGEWITDPSDPRITAVLLPPIVFDENHTKCDAATNVAEHLNDVITETSDQLGGTGSIIEIASVLALAIFAIFLAPESIPVLVPLILPLISAILFLGQAAFDAYFDSTVHDLILCSVFCSIGDDGTFTAGQYADLISRLTADLPASPAKDYFIQVVGRIGLVGINDYAAIGTSSDADCSDCNCGCGDLIYHIEQGTLVSQSTDEDGNCVLVIDSQFTGSHSDIEIFWNASSAPLVGDKAKVDSITATLPIGGGSSDRINAYFWRPVENDLVVSSTGGTDCGNGSLYESNLTTAFTVTLTVTLTDPGCM